MTTKYVDRSKNPSSFHARQARKVMELVTDGGVAASLDRPRLSALAVRSPQLEYLNVVWLSGITQMTIETHLQFSFWWIESVVIRPNKKKQENNPFQWLLLE